MLIYPLPDYGLVDYLAIVDLQPVNIVTVVDDKGGSGGFFYLKFLRKCGLDIQGKMKTSESIKQSTGIPDHFLPLPTHKYKVLYGVKKASDPLSGVSPPLSGVSPPLSGREMWLAVLKRDCKLLGAVTHYSKMLCNSEDIVCIGRDSVERKADMVFKLMYGLFNKLERHPHSDCCNPKNVCICGKVCEELKKCGRCNVKCYCSKECQVGDWKFHKRNCLE
jgi:hypothetical protein